MIIRDALRKTLGGLEKLWQSSCEPYIYKSARLATTSSIWRISQISFIYETIGITTNSQMDEHQSFQCSRATCTNVALLVLWYFWHIDTRQSVQVSAFTAGMESRACLHTWHLARFTRPSKLCATNAARAWAKNETPSACLHRWHGK